MKSPKMEVSLFARSVFSAISVLGGVALLASGCNVTTSGTTDTSTSTTTTNSYTVTPSATNAAASPSAAQTVASGATQAFTVTASTGYTLSTTVGGTCTAGTWSGSTYTTGGVTANCTATFTSTLNTYSVTPSGTNVTVDPSSVQTVGYGSTKAFIVTPSSGYTTSTVVGGTCAAGSWSGTTYTTGIVSANCTVTFSAALGAYTVTPSVTNVTVSPSSVQTVASGSTQAFTVTASSYNVSSTVGGTCAAGSWNGTVYTTGAVISNCTVTFGVVQSSCAATSNTLATTSTTNSCNLLTRNTAPCKASREAAWMAAGLTAADYDNSNWSKFSCNVTLSIIAGSGTPGGSNSSCPGVTLDSGSNCCPSSAGSCVEIEVNGEPDYLSYAWGSSNACYLSQTPSYPDPNSLSSQTIYMFVPLTPTTDTSGTTEMSLGAVGIAINGVMIYDNQASGSDNIFDESFSFDYCQGHADNANRYHYHSAPYSISTTDDNLVGVMADGYFIFGTKDSDNSTAYSSSGWAAYYGGHSATMPSGTLADGVTTSAFHYHLNYQSGTTNSYKVSGSTVAASGYFVTGCANTSGTVPSSNSATATSSCSFAPFYYGKKGSCSGCL